MSSMNVRLIEFQKPGAIRHSHYLRGNIFESFIISEHFKTRLHTGHHPKAFFWCNSAGYEIDLLLETGADLQAVEIKSGETLNEDFLKTFDISRDCLQHLTRIFFCYMAAIVI